MTYFTRREEKFCDKPHPIADWTLLIYQASDNNLSEDCVYSLGEMSKAVCRERAKRKGKAESNTTDANPPLHIVAQLDPVGRGNNTRVFELTKPADNLADKVIAEFSHETDTDRPITLIRFLSESIRCYPARHYMLVLAGHGAGVLDGFFLQDDSRNLTSVPSAFQIRYLQDVFRDPAVKKALGRRKIDILGFDSCMMSMIEICYQLLPADLVGLVIGSEGFALNSGWPYEAIVTKMEQGIGNAESLAKAVVKEHIDFYYDYYLGGLSVDISAVRVNRIPMLKNRIDKLAEALEKELTLDYYDEHGEPFQDAILLTHWAAQSYNGEQCVDLYDFCYLLKKRLKAADFPTVTRYCQKVMDAIQNLQNPGDTGTVVIQSDYSGPAFQYSHGLSIYLPWSDFDIAPEYKLLEFGKNGRKLSPWLSFVQCYTKATRRKSRLPKKGPKAELRSTPPYSKGPDGVVRSMRNPPVGF